MSALEVIIPFTLFKTIPASVSSMVENLTTLEPPTIALPLVIPPTVIFSSVALLSAA